ncbi:MAG TPA: hypothetical protein VNL98_08930 [Gemmatimonadales bacterium]|nr:hypothetical protein [Gemmatimonadales bacterium]
MQALIVQTFIAAAADAVWAALVERPDLLFDALPASRWPVETSDQPPFHRSLTWPHTPEPTPLSFTIHELMGGVRLDLRHEGWHEDDPAWEAAIHGHFSGWLHGLALLGLWVETGADARVSDPALQGRERYLISGEVPAPADAVFRSLSDPDVVVRWSEGAFDGLTMAEQVEDKLVRWSAPGREVAAVLRATPRGTHVALAEYGVEDRSASARWPQAFDRLSRFLL